jgi:ferredoxin
VKRQLDKYSVIDTGFFGLSEDGVEHYSEKVVKCRKSHICSSCNAEISKGHYAIRETGFLDGEPVSNYVCITCLDNWMDEIEEEREEESESPNE